MERVRQEVAISARERKIIEKFQQFQPDAKKRVQQILADTLPQPTFDYFVWGASLRRCKRTFGHAWERLQQSGHCLCWKNYVRKPLVK
jgi:hypothetical protein